LLVNLKNSQALGAQPPDSRLSSMTR